MGVALILAGGIGERFWPVSTAGRPKQFVPLTGSIPIIKETVNRVKDLVGLQKVFVVTTKSQSPLVKEILPEVPEENIIAEPEGRNTGPGLVLSAAYFKGKLGADETIAVLPADHYIGDPVSFRQALNRAFEYAILSKEIVTLGIKPDRPETEYGYISVGQAMDSSVFNGIKFVEKPDFTKALEYVSKGTYLWNSGVFVFQLTVFISLLEKHSPELYKSYLELQKAVNDDIVEEIYSRMPRISIDYALMEKLLKFVVIHADYPWDDLGSWRSMETVYKKNRQGNIIVGPSELIDVTDCVVYSQDKPVAAIGVKDLVIAVSNEGTLICPKDRLRDVKQIVERLKTKINPNIFREYDIRGIVGKELTPPVVFRIGQSIGTIMKAKNLGRALVGGDIRVSTPEIRLNLINGLTSVGINVVDIGTVTTPLFYFGLHHLEVDGGVMITGSHNPKEFNGLKIAFGRSTIYGKDIQEIRKIAERDIIVKSANKSEITKTDISNEYLNMLFEKIKLGPRRLKVVTDAGNGAAGLYIEKFIQSLGAEVIPLFCNVDGGFPNHHPDPVKAGNLVDLIETVSKHKANLGVAYDGDADRLGVVDDKGNIIWGDKLMILFWREILSKHPGETALVEVKCSRALVDEITRLGGKPCFCKTGHSLIKAKMKETNALFAGEMSGHMFFADEFYGFDDAFYATGRLLRVLSNTDKTLSELLSDIPVYYNTAETRIDCPDEHKFEVITKIREEALKQYNAVTVDGVRINYPDGWGLVRASNTQPVLVARCESRSKTGLELITADLKERILGAGVNDFTWE